MTRAEANKEKHVRGGWTWEACRKQADFHADSEERLDLYTVRFEWPDGSISIFSETSKDIHTANGSTKMLLTQAHALKALWKDCDWPWQLCLAHAAAKAKSAKAINSVTTRFEWDDGSISVFTKTPKEIHAFQKTQKENEMVKTVKIKPHKKEEELTLVRGDIYTMKGSVYILGAAGGLHTLINIDTGCLFTTSGEKKRLLYEMTKNGAKQFQGKIVIEVK